MAKRLYPDVAIFVIGENVYAVSDKLYQVTALAVIQIFNLDGKLVNKIEKEVVLQQNEVKLIYELKGSDFKETPKQ